MTETVFLCLGIKLCLLVPELNILLWRPQIWRHHSPFTVHIKLSPIILGARYLYTIICILISSCHTLSFEIPVPNTHSLCHTHSKPFTCHSGKLSEKLILSYTVFPSCFCHCLVTHIICHWHHHFPLQISGFRPNLSPTLDGALQSTVLRNGEAKMHKTLSRWCWWMSGCVWFVWKRVAYQHVWKLTWWMNTWKAHAWTVASVSYHYGWRAQVKMCSGQRKDARGSCGLAPCPRIHRS